MTKIQHHDGIFDLLAGESYTLKQIVNSWIDTMGFFVQIEADFGSEVLSNLHPDGKLSGGNAVLAFLVGLENYRQWIRNPGIDISNIEEAIHWYSSLEQAYPASLFTVCNAILDCMWTDGGDPYERYSEQDYDLFLKHHSELGITTEEQFLSALSEARSKWQPINDVMQGIHHLLNISSIRSGIEPLEGCYMPEDTILDFEALIFNISLLAQRNHEVVRLNFI